MTPNDCNEPNSAREPSDYAFISGIGALLEAELKLRTVLACAAVVQRGRPELRRMLREHEAEVNAIVTLLQRIFATLACADQFQALVNRFSNDAADDDFASDLAAETGRPAVARLIKLHTEALRCLGDLVQIDLTDHRGDQFLRAITRRHSLMLARIADLAAEESPLAFLGRRS